MHLFKYITQTWTQLMKNNCIPGPTSPWPWQGSRPWPTTSARWNRVPWRGRPTSIYEKKKVIYYSQIEPYGQKNWKETHLPSLEGDIYHCTKTRRYQTSFNFTELKLWLSYIACIYTCLCFHPAKIFSCMEKFTFRRTHTHKLTQTQRRTCATAKQLSNIEELSSTD